MNTAKAPAVIKPARFEADGTPRGVDITAHHDDLCRLCLAYFRSNRATFRAAERDGRAGRRVEADDFVQDVLLTIHRRNSMDSAFDARRGGLSKYLWNVARTVASHATERQESDSLFSDAADVGRVSDAADPAASALREHLAEVASAPAIRAFVKSIEQDMVTGQVRLFAPAVEQPELADVAA